MTLQIKANSWYRTRGGEIAYVAGIVPEDRTYPVVGCDKGDVNSWMLCGRYIEDDVDDHDLVEHLPDCDSFDWKPKPKIQLEAGKKYVLANGHTVGPMVLHSISTHIPKYYSQGNVGCMWFKDGGRAALSDRPYENIVSEYIEPTPTYEPWDFESMPEFVRVKAKECGTRWVARPASDNHCMHGIFACTYKELFNHYTQLDGKPCGRVKQ